MMATQTANDWTQANQRYLMAALERVRLALRRHASPAKSGDAKPPAVGKEGPQASAMLEAESALDEAQAAMPAPAALQTLCGGFNLTDFERDVVLLCAGVDLDSAFAGLVAEAQGDARRTSPTFSLALAALPGAHWSAAAPSRPLRRWRLVEVEPGGTVSASALRIDERVLHFLTGVDYLDERLAPLVRPAPVDLDAPPSQLRVARRAAEAFAGASEGEDRPIVQLCGDDADGRCAVAAAACRVLRLAMCVLRAAELPTVAADRENLARLWEREAALSGSGLLIEAEDAGDPQSVRELTAFLETLGGIVILSRRDPLSLPHRAVIRLDVAKPLPGEQRDMWTRTLAPLVPQLNGEMDRVLAQFNLSSRAIAAAGARVAREAADLDSGALGARLWEACCAQTRPKLDDLAQRLVPSASWDDLVLPEGEIRLLRQVAAQVRGRFTVYDTWGFASRCSRGLGISALFTGASGTGKTMAAEVLAQDLKLDLYRIDLSSVVNKYIGETEKNLRRIFDAAEDSGVILLFDEADALFGKRSEVRDSHDRYANIEVSYLLQRMEAYRGLAVLTSNMKSALDQAFLRRIRFVVQFPMPDVMQRAEIWRRAFPEGVPREGLDPARLAQLSIPGGSIRNIALGAAFLAADEGATVRMSHILRAARTEYAKMEKPLTDAEIRGWA